MLLVAPPRRRRDAVVGERRRPRTPVSSARRSRREVTGAQRTRQLIGAAVAGEDGGCQRVSVPLPVWRDAVRADQAQERAVAPEQES